MKKLNLFHFDFDEAHSYALPILKIVFCLPIIALVSDRRRFSSLEQGSILDIICAIVGLFFVYIMVVSMGELLAVFCNRYENRKNNSRKNNKSRWFSTDKIVTLARENDIIEIQILSNNSRIKLGASSVSNPGDSTFCDKLYYIGKEEFDNIESFKIELSKYTDDGKLLVVSIDDVSPECYL